MIPAIVALDTATEHFVDTNRPAILITLFTLLTQLGDARWITVVALAMAVVAWRHKRFEYKAGLAVALFGSLGMSYLIKILVQRVRPDSHFALIEVTGYSFPSMHAAVSLATYGFLAYMIYKLMHPPHHRVPWIIFLSLLIFCIGFSRIYLGVHYVSDVLGGFAIGALFLWLGVVVTNRVAQKRNRH